MESVFFWISKLAWLVIAPGSLLVMLVWAAWLLLGRKPLAARRMMGFVSIVLLVAAIFPVDEWMLYPLEKRFPANPSLPRKINGIIILGGPEDALRSDAWNQVELKEGAERFLAAMMLARRYPDARLVFAGGSAGLLSQKHKGADVAERLFREQGLDVSRIVFERNSRNTFENMALSKELVKPAAGERWILVTSAGHMPRAVGIFCKAGWPVIPYPVDHQTNIGELFRVDVDVTEHLRYLDIGAREWIGLLAYYATGKTTALLPQGCEGMKNTMEAQ